MKKHKVHKVKTSNFIFEVYDMSSYCETNEPHCHMAHQTSDYQLLWFTSPGQHFVDYKAIKFTGNSFLFLEKGQTHHFCKNSKNRGYIFQFNEEFLFMHGDDLRYKIKLRMFNAFDTSCVTPPIECTNEIGSLTKYIIKETERKNIDYQQRVFFLLQSILLKIERIKSESSQRAGVNIKEYELIVNFKVEIEKNIGKPYSVEKYSELLNVSRKKLNSVVKQHLKDTAAQYIYKRKILEAKRLLSNTTLSIKEVAYELGFDQPTYFTKFFKRFTNMTPKDFLKQSKVSIE